MTTNPTGAAMSMSPSTQSLIRAALDARLVQRKALVDSIAEGLAVFDREIAEFRADLGEPQPLFSAPTSPVTIVPSGRGPLRFTVPRRTAAQLAGPVQKRESRQCPTCGPEMLYQNTGYVAQARRLAIGHIEGADRVWLSDAAWAQIVPPMSKRSA